ncbi:ABC1-domain-containing protein [Coccomyxa subellipsoidea C-169]|uniref:ABC1-domain-containing protein n=1 Tax=Coccomyxa subellipsoidea (strain C-169) TaxID=574566 RepID=I0Z1K2_COCSC|nr:ABC1-domain-containing protein [Coccomyxa subellipsoidea C-169]EIE24521.1 ABC1-domain-containing protein [Coccomyxa subellipsoidea C-169]|eukprot:XP_005649065.1 ABC1-domain-containing protein [Coccomyxa subellipsoidea C-169]
MRLLLSSKFLGSTRTCLAVKIRERSPVSVGIRCRAASTLRGSLYSTPLSEQRARERDASARRAAFQEILTELSNTVTRNGARGFQRSLQALQAALSVGNEYVANFQRGVQDPPQVVLRKLFERLGATYIKLGQFIASSPTLFPEEYVLEFEKCLDKTDPVPWEVIRGRMRAQLGRPLEDVFSFVDPVPLASASVAQVHAAVLKDSGKEVVVKVLKPGVEDVLATDLDFLYLASRVFEFINPELSRMSLAAIVGDIRACMLEEVDFLKEATHISEFAQYLERTGATGVAACPFVYRAFSTKSMLVMERFRGVPLTDLAAIRSMTSADPESVLVNALNVWFGSVLACETFHADMHAGNLLVLEERNGQASGRVGFIDFGIVGRVSPGTWMAVEALLTSVATRDFDTMARALVTVGATSTDVEIKAFAADLERLYTGFSTLDAEVLVAAGRGGQAAAASLNLDDAQINRLLLQIVQVGNDHGIRFPRELGMLLKQLLYFDRYTRILAPELSVLDDERIRLR